MNNKDFIFVQKHIENNSYLPMLYSLLDCDMNIQLFMVYNDGLEIL